MANHDTNALPAPAPILGFLLVHAALRRETALLADLAARGEPIGARVALIDRVIRAHHHGEDRVLLPTLTRRHGELAGIGHLIEAQHVALDEGLDALRELCRSGPTHAVAAAVIALRDAVEAHLQLEETRLLPAWVASLSPVEHAAFARRLRRSTPWRDIAVMIPWLLDAVSEDLRPLARKELPRHVRLANRAWFQRRFARRFGLLAARRPALGAAELMPVAA